MKKKRKYVRPCLRCYPMEPLMDQPFRASGNDLPDYMLDDDWDSVDGSGLWDYVRGKSWNSADGSGLGNYNPPPGGSGWESWLDGENGN